MIRFACPVCRAKLRAPEGRSGTQARCPTCHQKVLVPSASPLETVVAQQSVPPPAPTAPPAKMVEDIFLHFQGQQRGPFSKAQIQAMWNNGAITAGALYWRQGMAEWTSVCDFFDQAVLAHSSQARAPTAAVTPAKVRYNEGDDVFLGSLSQVMKLALKAVHKLGYKVDNANETLGLLTFQTGITWGSWSGALCSLQFEEVCENAFRVTGSGKQNITGGQLFAIDFGEAKGRAKKVIRRMKTLAEE